MKVIIVGASLPAWKEEQIPRVNEVIYTILWNAQSGALVVPRIAYLDNKSYIATTFVRDIRGIINVVSGHCPVGRKRWYNITKDRWSSIQGEMESPLVMGSTTYIRVYDQGGVNTWAEIIATRLGIKKEIYLAPAKQWNDKYVHEDGHTHMGETVVDYEVKLKGYRSRNIQIAESGLKELVGRPMLSVKLEDSQKYALYDLEPAKSCKHCGGLGFNFIQDRESDQTKKCKFCEGDGAYSGGTWTYKWARKLGREVHKVILD